jgi:CBS domain-containing protein
VKETVISAIMMREPVTMGPDATLDLANNLMSLGLIRHLPIINGERTVGVLSQRDLFRSTIATAVSYEHKAEKTLLKATKIKEVMSSPVITASPEATVKEASMLMADKKIGCLPVLAEGRLVGLVTQTDILRYVVNL